MTTKTINFNFTSEQEEQFNVILNETKRVYPNLMVDDVSIERVKVLIAHSVITGDLPFKRDKKESEEPKDEIEPEESS